MHADNDTAPLHGFLEEERDDELRVRVPHGVWIVDRADVVDMTDWENPVDAEGVGGRPVQVKMRDGAQLDFLQTVRVKASERPMTLSDGPLPEIVGREMLDQMGRTWAGRHGFAVVDAGAGSSPSACCWETGTWGTDCSPDDCMD